jgi:hypothetical protein
MQVLRAEANRRLRIGKDASSAPRRLRRRSEWLRFTLGNSRDQEGQLFRGALGVEIGHPLQTMWAVLLLILAFVPWLLLLLKLCS